MKLFNKKTGKIVYNRGDSPHVVEISDAMASLVPTDYGIESAWVERSLKDAAYQISLHEDGYEGKSLTVNDWRQFRCSLHDYIKGGVINGERPVNPLEV